MALVTQQLANALHLAVEQAVAAYGLTECATVLEDPSFARVVAQSIPGAADLTQDVSVYSQALVHIPSAFMPEVNCDTPETFTPVPVEPGTVKGALAAATLNHLLGLNTVSYGSENDGVPFVSLVPQSGKGRKARKSLKAMRGHTDGVTFPFPGTRDEQYPQMAPAPDWVCLVCIRNPNMVATRVVPVDPLLKQLPPELRRAMTQPQFTIGAQGTFKEGMRRILGEEHIIDGGALLNGEDDYAFRFSHSSVAAGPEASTDAEKVLAAIESYCENSSVAVTLEPGDLLWVNNRRAIHGRAEVGAAVGGHERWLLRTYGIREQLIAPDQRYTDRPFQLYP